MSHNFPTICSKCYALAASDTFFFSVGRTFGYACFKGMLLKVDKDRVIQFKLDILKKTRGVREELLF